MRDVGGSNNSLKDEIAVHWQKEREQADDDQDFAKPVETHVNDEMKCVLMQLRARFIERLFRPKGFLRKTFGPAVLMSAWEHAQQGGRMEVP